MAAIPVKTEALASCKGEVVVITGGASGIGAATVKRYFDSGAHVVFSDINTAEGTALEKSLTTGPLQSGGTAVFITVDVTSYASQLALFDLAIATHGRVDHAVYSAGVSEPLEPQFVGAALTVAAVREPPAPLMRQLDINLVGALWFARLALAYLQHGADRTELLAKRSKSLTLISSAQAFLEVPGLYGYSTTKHGLLGLVRAMRQLVPRQCGVRVNLMAPSATATPMIGNAKRLFVDNGVPLNSADEVALYTQLLGADRTLNGKAVYVVGGKGFDVEEGLDKLLPQWLGEENAKAWELHNEVFGKESWADTAH